MQTIPLPSLWDDQQTVIDSIRETARKSKSMIVCSPCGSGKTRMASWIAISALNKGGTVIFDAPLKDLRRQISNTWRDLGIDHSFVSSGMRYNPFSRAFVSTSATLAGRLDKAPRANVVIFDETHLLGAQRERVILHYKDQGATIIGLSASPERTDGQDLSDLYEEFIEGLSPGELMDMGRLSGYVLHTPSRPDFSKLRVANGDYMKTDIESFMESQSQIVGDIVDAYKKFAFEKRHLAFATSIKHSHQIVEAFKAGGVTAVHIDGGMDDAERNKLIKAWARREIKVISSVNLFLAGFDAAQASGDPTAVVESISDGRPTKSRPVQTQKAGRATRLKPDKSDAIIIDHSSNCFHPDGSVHHGTPDMQITWQWRGKEKKGPGGGGDRQIPVRQCEVCFFVSRPSEVCPSCGHRHEVKSRMVEEVEGELYTVTREELRGIQKEERKLQGKAKSLEDLVLLGKRKGYKNPHAWASKVMAGRKRG